MSDLYPTLADQSRLRLDERYTTRPRAPRAPRPVQRHRVARTLRAVADRLDS